MGKDRKRKQQKKTQKAAKAKAKKAQHKKHITLHGGGAPLSMRGAFQAPVYECWEPRNLFERTMGIGSVVITRKTEQHRILIGVFLVDVFCLGVKDAFVRLLSESEYRTFLGQLRTREKLRSVSPARARKLVENAEDYARDLGFEPHRDYRTAKKIFGEIDPDECLDSFEFGHEGKPLYIAGPFDDQRSQERIMNTLTKKLGPEGFHYLMPLGDPPPGFFE